MMEGITKHVISPTQEIRTYPNGESLIWNKGGTTNITYNENNEMIIETHEYWFPTRLILIRGSV